MKALKPQTIIETGTLAGHATLVFAVGLRDAGVSGTIYTIDYDGDPVQDAKGNSGVTKEDWTTLRENRLANLDIARDVAPNVTIEFVEGDSRKVLPPLVERTPPWDFWFQDSMHFKSGIQDELNILAPHSSEDAVAVFDNVDRVHPFGRWYTGHLKDDAAYRSVTEGRSRQLWVHARGGLPR